MAQSPIAARYAQAAFESAVETKQVEETLEQLELIRWLLRKEHDARQLLFNPDVDPEEKLEVLDRIFQGQWSALVRGLVLVVARFGRTEYLDEIATAFGELVDAQQGRVRAVVRTAHPLSEPVLKRLQGILERREGKHVVLSAELDPALLGGLQVRLGHRLIDGSVQRQIADLREQLRSTKVN